MTRRPLKTILYVEDNPNIRALAKIALEKLGGFSVSTCESGAEAIDAVNSGLTPDLLLLDVMLPGMDGPTILERLRQLPRTAQAPAIFMTAKAQSSEIAYFLSLGALGVITKPFQPTTLSAEISQLWNSDEPSTPATGNIDDKLGHFRAAFAERLPAKLDALTILSGNAASAARAELVEMQHLLHGIAGSAGTFGFRELGSRARHVEELVHAHLASGAVTDDRSALVSALGDFLAWCRAGGTLHPDTSLHGADIPPRRPPSPSNRAERVVCLVGTAIGQGDLAGQLAHFGHEVMQFANMAELAKTIGTDIAVSIVIDADRPDDIPAICAEAGRLRAAREAGLCDIVLLSAVGDMRTRLAAVRAGIEGFVQKPVDAAALVEHLGRLAKPESEQPYRVLIVDDDATMAAYYQTILRAARIDASTTSTPDDILGALERYRPELIVMDLYMPECSGADLAKIIRQDRAYLDVPIVFLSSEHNLDRQSAAIESGADYFLTKPISPDRLVSVLSSRAERYRALRGLIMRDGLTGLYNHTAIKEHLQREVARAARGSQPLVLAMIDLDFFKRINDTWGHPAGDQVLRALARIMHQRFRRGDLIGRYGGEEFSAILPSTSSDDAVRVLNDVREAFSRIRFHAGDAEFSATFSAGIAALGPNDDAESLLYRADLMLYRAKEDGRNRIEAA
jgi:diguanylate cyclase (GGDEF)-like protein